MTFSTITDLETYINRYIGANGTNSITGEQMNTVLTGITQFLEQAGGYEKGSLSYAVTTTLGSGSTLNILTSLDFTPSLVLLSSKNAYTSTTFFPQHYYLVYVLGGVQLVTTGATSTTGTISFDYIAFR